MIPYFSYTQLMLGPVPVQVWGAFVALGVLLGAYVAARYARRQGLDPEIVWLGASYIIIAAFIGARLAHVLLYEPAYFVAHPIDAFKIWLGGFSIMGGFAGAIGGYALFVRRHKLDWMRYVDVFMYGLPAGVACGRIGCFLVHDHPGTLTDFFLGVRYSNGETRHDLGLYESLQSAALALVFMALARPAMSVKPRLPAFYTRLFLLWYGVVRFGLDFLRVADARYAGLTPAQYISLAMVAAAVVWTLALRRHRAI